MVVLQTIILRQHLGLGQGREQLAVEKLIPQATVERLADNEPSQRATGQAPNKKGGALLTSRRRSRSPPDAGDRT